MIKDIYGEKHDICPRCHEKWKQSNANTECNSNILDLLKNIDKSCTKVYGNIYFPGLSELVSTIEESKNIVYILHWKLEHCIVTTKERKVYGGSWEQIAQTSLETKLPYDITLERLKKLLVFS